MLTRIHLHGALKRFGEVFDMDISSPAEAFRALSSQLDGFRETIQEGHFRLIRGGADMDLVALDFPIGQNDFHIVPVIAGAKNGGVGKIIAGVAIMAASYFTAGSFAAMGSTFLAGSATSTFSISMSSVFVFGAALSLSGISMMMQPSVKMGAYDGRETDQRASAFLGGQVNQSVQGGPVVLAYGRIRLGSTVISAGLTTTQL